MKIGEKGLDLIRRFEGCRLMPYRCPAGVLTVGYGSTGPHVRQNAPITQAAAEALLIKDVARFEQGVTGMVGSTTQEMFSALVSFSFNLGLGALMGSTLLKKHKAGLYLEAGDQFLLWVNAGGRVMRGLVARRQAERALYLSGKR